MGVVQKLWPYWTYGRVFQTGRTAAGKEEKQENVDGVVGILRSAAWLQQRKPVGQQLAMTPGRRPEKPTGCKIRNRTCHTSLHVPCPLPQRVPFNSPLLLFSLLMNFCFKILGAPVSLKCHVQEWTWPQPLWTVRRQESTETIRDRGKAPELWSQTDPGSNPAFTT